MEAWNRRVKALREANGPAWTKAAFLAWGAVLAAVTVYALCFPDQHSVFPVYAGASRQFVAGSPLYPLGTRDEYRYAPAFAVTAIPFALLPGPVGGAAWKLAGGLLLLWAMAGFARRALGAGEKERALFLLLALPTSLISLHNGQANTAALALLLWGTTAVVEGRHRRAGLLLAAAVLIKGYPLALALLLAALGAWRLLPWAGVGLSAGLALPFLFQRPSYVLAETGTWIALLGATSGIRKSGYRSFDQILRVAGLDPAPAAVLAVSAATGILVLGLALLFARVVQSPRRAAVNALFLFTAWAVVFGPAAEPATYVLLGPGLAWALIAARSPSTPPLVGAALVASYLLTGPLATDLLGGTVRRTLANHGSLPVGGLLFFLVLAAESLSPRGRAIPPPSGGAPAGPAPRR